MNKGDASVTPSEDDFSALTQRIKDIKLASPGIFAKDIHEALHADAEGGKWNFATIGRVKKVNGRINKLLEEPTPSGGAGEGGAQGDGGANKHIFGLSQWPEGKLNAYLRGAETSIIQPVENIRLWQERSGLDVGDLSDLHYRTSLSIIGEKLDEEGCRLYMIQDSEDTQGIVLYVHGVLVDVETTRPLFVCDYKFNTKAALMKDPSPMEHISAAVSYNNYARGAPVRKIIATVAEQAYWLRELQAGEKRAKAGTPPAGGGRQPSHPARAAVLLGFTRSATLCPIAVGHDGVKPASQKVCGGCGESPGGTMKICGGCNGVMYCNRKCQKAHWKKHKTVCGVTSSEAAPAEDGSESVVVPVDYCPESFKGLYTSNLSYQGVMSKQRAPGAIPRNIHGESQFMIKVQVPLGGGAGPMMIYDEARSFSRMMDAAEGEAYKKVKSLVTKVGVMGGAKGYLWCRREGANFRISVEERGLPSQQQRW